MNTRKLTAEYRIAHWTQIIQSRASTGVSVDAFCQERGISRNAYYYWQRKVREAACEQLSIRQASTSIQSNRLRFTEVRVESPVSMSAPFPTDGIRMEYGGVNISFGYSYPPAQLAAVILELTRP